MYLKQLLTIFPPSLKRPQSSTGRHILVTGHRTEPDSVSRMLLLSIFRPPIVRRGSVDNPVKICPVYGKKQLVVNLWLPWSKGLNLIISDWSGKSICALYNSFLIIVLIGIKNRKEAHLSVSVFSMFNSNDEKEGAALNPYLIIPRGTWASYIKRVAFPYLLVIRRIKEMHAKVRYSCEQRG